jgi:tetratricopeptide (TPR) repeat protein
MVDRQNQQNPGHDEVIVPVRPGDRSAASAAAPQRPRGTPPPWPLVAVSVLLLGLVGGVFFVLPSWVEDRESQPAVTPPPAAEEAPAAPALPPEEIEALRQQAEALLAQLLSQQALLSERAASVWGGEAWTEYGQLARAGDDAYLADAFQEAVPAYSQALEVGNALLERSGTIIESALRAGAEALAAGNAAVATEQFHLALEIDAANETAQSGLERAENLPEVLAAVRRGQEAERGGEPERAAAAYREALALDAAWQPAGDALQRIERDLRDRRFDDAMSRGFAALAAEDFESAHEHFNAALAIRPGAAEALDGELQAEQGRRLAQIALLEARALAFERRELWAQAIDLYERALETDTTLRFAQDGLKRARERVDLDSKMNHLLANPNLLFDDRVLEDSHGLLAGAREVESPGPRLEEQIQELGRLVTLASTPVSVELRSDEMTEVTLYRVGNLGSFAATTLELRPGTYTAVGSRNGYRDVRETFSIIPGRPLEPIRVQCVEPI